MDPTSQKLQHRDETDALLRDAISKAVSDVQKKRVWDAGDIETFMNSTTDGITVQNKEGKIVYANKHGASLIGFPSVEALLAADIPQLMSNFYMMDEEGEPLPLSAMPSRRALAGEEAPNRLLRFRVRKTGEEKWSLVRASPLLDDEGHVRGIINFFQDVTEQKRLEFQSKFLTEASSLLMSSLDTNQILHDLAKLAVPKLADWCAVYVVNSQDIPECIAVAHKDPAKVEEALQVQKEYPSDPHSKKGVAGVIRNQKSEWAPTITPEMIQLAAKDERHARLLASLGFTSAMIIPLMGREKAVGAIAFISAESNRPFNKADLNFAEDFGRRVGLALENAKLYEKAQLEVQERLKAEEAVKKLNTELEKKVEERTQELHAALERVKSMISHLSVAAIAMDEHNMILEVNQLFCNMLPYPVTPKDLIGKKGTDLTSTWSTLVEHSEEELTAIFAALKEQRQMLGRELHMKDGRILLQDFVPIILDHNTLRGWLFLYRDVTQERRMDRSKSEFMSLASHQLRTPLTAIRWTFGRLEKSLQEKGEEKSLRLVRDGKDAALRMAETINTMLMISRLESGNIHLKKQTMHLKDFVSTIVSQHQEAIARKHHDVTVECSDSIQITTDEKCLNELLTNLLTNAIKYTPPGGDIRIRCTAGSTHARIDVIDSGYGIPLEQQTKVFSKFFRGQNIVAEDTEGTGLGLYLASLIAKLLDAQMSFESEEGKGTAFTVLLPLR
jgi:PAS domain S-box-containing protein